MVTRMGRACFGGGQLRHCTSTNASRGLSAVAEFLIYTNKSYAAVKVHQNAGMSKMLSPDARFFY